MANDIEICAVCGRPLTAAAADGLCPACLLERGLEANTLESENMATGQQPWLPPTPAELAGQFPGLEIGELIGRGGMGAVYKATQLSLHRTVALKILPPEIGKNADFAQRFSREAQAMAKLNHPHIVAIYDFGQSAGLFYFLMEFVDGPSLRHILNRGGVSPDEALAIVPQICEALQYAHDQGIVHRDIKPENILMNRQGQIKIADFGLARLMGLEESALAETKMADTEGLEKIVGTPGYMAPEQKTRSDAVDHRADIYSLGVVFYQLLTGEMPGKQIIPPSQKIPMDSRLDDIVLRTLEQEPDRRYQHASEVKTEVETVVDSRGKAVEGVRGLENPPSPGQYPNAETEARNPTAGPGQGVQRSRRWRFGLLAAVAVLLLTLPLTLHFTAMLGEAGGSGAPIVSGMRTLAYNMFITPRMVYRHQKVTVRLRYITPLFGRKEGVVPFPVWDAKGRPVTRVGIHRFLFNNAVGHISYSQGRVLFLVFSVPGGAAKNGFWYSCSEINSPHNKVMALGGFGGAPGFGTQFGGLFWFSVAVGNLNGRRLPAGVDVPLRIAYGPWKAGKTRFPGPLTNFTTSSNHLNIIGFGAAQAGKSFADIVWLKSSFRKTERILAAYTHKGARMLPLVTNGSHQVGSSTRPQRVEYAVPLRQIKYFRILSRPIHTIVFHNVALEPNAPPVTTSPAATSAYWPAVAAAKSWLALIDSGHYAKAWKAASSIFRGAVTLPQWKHSMNIFRKPLGKLLARNLKSAQQVTHLPGSPDGHYAVMHFEASFTNKKAAVETVTFALQPSGKWRSVGYYIK